MGCRNSHELNSASSRIQIQSLVIGRTDGRTDAHTHTHTQLRVNDAFNVIPLRAGPLAIRI